MPNTDTSTQQVETDADFLSVNDAAKELHITPRAVRHRIQVGTLSATKLGPGTASYVITRDEIARVKSADSARASA